jgi:hypothetical protein
MACLLCLLVAFVGSRSGDAARALDNGRGVAYRDFSKQLKRWEDKWTASGHHESASQHYASDVDNYSIAVSSDDKNVYVTFELKPFQSRSAFGGVTRYTMDRKTHEIVERTDEK